MSPGMLAALSPYNPLTPHTPHTPLYLPSPGGGDASPISATVGPFATRDAAGTDGPAPVPLDLPTLQATVADAVAGVLGSAIGADQPLMAAGLDSLGATELQQGLADRVGLELPATLVFDYPTVNAIAEFVHDKLAAVGTAPAA